MGVKDIGWLYIRSKNNSTRFRFLDELLAFSTILSKLMKKFAEKQGSKYGKKC